MSQEPFNFQFQDESNSEPASNSSGVNIDRENAAYIEQPQARDFLMLSMVMQVIGFPVAFISLLLIQVPELWKYTIPSLLLGIAFVVAGYGFGAYKRWAWMLTVIVLVPLAALISLFGAISSLWIWYETGGYAILPIMMACFIVYVCKVLLSHGGRKRYYETVDAMLRAKADPTSIAGIAYRKGQTRMRNYLWGAGLFFSVVTTFYVLFQMSLPPTDPPKVAAYFKKLARDYRTDSDGNLLYLHLDGTKVTDADLVQLKQLLKIKEVGLDETEITDEGLKHLHGIPTLQTVKLDATKITNRGLQGFIDSNINYLKLRHTEIDDDALVILAKIKSLRRLDVSYTSVTDVGLLALAEKKNLQKFYVRGTQVTDEGIKALKKKLPYCRISHRTAL